MTKEELEIINSLSDELSSLDNLLKETIDNHDFEGALMILETITHRVGLLKRNLEE